MEQQFDKKAWDQAMVRVWRWEACTCTGAQADYGMLQVQTSPKSLNQLDPLPCLLAPCEGCNCQRDISSAPQEETLAAMPCLQTPSEAPSVRERATAARQAAVLIRALTSPSLSASGGGGWGGKGGRQWAHSSVGGNERDGAAVVGVALSAALTLAQVRMSRAHRLKLAK